MLKPTANFKLNKTVKRMMGACSDPQYSNMIKRNFVQAQLYSNQQYKPARGNKEGKGE